MVAACRLSHPQTTTTTTGQECRIPMTTINEIMHDGAQGSSSGIEIKFSHVQLYVDHVCPVDEYKQFEAEVNKKFLESYSQCSSNKDETAFPCHGRDVVKVRQATSIVVFSTKGIPTLFDVINPNSTLPYEITATYCRVWVLRHGMLSRCPCLLSNHHKDSTGDKQ
jgi:hypothetical protein